MLYFQEMGRVSEQTVCVPSALMQNRYTWTQQIASSVTGKKKSSGDSSAKRERWNWRESRICDTDASPSSQRLLRLTKLSAVVILFLSLSLSRREFSASEYSSLFFLLPQKAPHTHGAKSTNAKRENWGWSLLSLSLAWFFGCWSDHHHSRRRRRCRCPTEQVENDEGNEGRLAPLPGSRSSDLPWRSGGQHVYVV